MWESGNNHNNFLRYRREWVSVVPVRWMRPTKSRIHGSNSGRAPTEFWDQVREFQRIFQLSGERERYILIAGSVFVHLSFCVFQLFFYLVNLLLLFFLFSIHFRSTWDNLALPWATKHHRGNKTFTYVSHEYVTQKIGFCLSSRASHR